MTHTPTVKATASMAATPGWAQLRTRLRNSSLIRDAALAIGLTGFGAVISYGVQIFLARSLGATGYGAYGYVLAWLNTVQLFTTFDLGNTSLRFVAVYRREQKWSLLHGFLHRSREIVLATSALVGIIVALGLARWGAQVSEATRWAGYAACALLPVSALLQLELNVLQGFKKVSESRVPNLILRPIVLAAGVALGIYGFGLSGSAVLAVLANLAACVAAVGVSAWHTRRVIRAEQTTTARAYDTKLWLSTAAGILATSIAQLVLSQQSDIVVVGSMVNVRHAGLYSAAGQLASLVTFGVQAVVMLASPSLAETHAAGTPGALRTLLGRLTLLNVVVSLPIAGAMLIAGPYLLRSYGSEFAIAYPTLVILIGAQVVSAVGGALIGTLLAMTGYHHPAARVAGVSAAFNLALTLALTPRFGIVGTASATLIATVARGIGMFVIAKRPPGV